MQLKSKCSECKSVVELHILSLGSQFTHTIVSAREILYGSHSKWIAVKNISYQADNYSGSRVINRKH